MLRKIIKISILVSLICCSLTGCVKEKASGTKTTLKIMYRDEESFYRTYGDLFQMDYPDIELAVVSTSELYKEGVTDEKLKEFIVKEQPDIIVLNAREYERFALEGELMALTSLIQRDRYNIDTIYPGMINFLKDAGGGELYGLSPTFHGSAIIYNKDLFEQYGIELPHDGMTWEEIINTARLFPTDGDSDTRIYGFGSRHPMSFETLLVSISSTYGLQILNSKAEELTINTEAWKNVFGLAIDAVKSNSIYSDNSGRFVSGAMDDYYRSQLFLVGRMGMTISEPMILSELIEARRVLPDSKPFEVGIVAGPVDPTASDKTRDVVVREIFSVREGAKNTETAWEFIKFISDDKYAKIKSRTLRNGLLSRMTISTAISEYNLEAFYKLEPQIHSGVIMENVPGLNYEQFVELQNREIELVFGNQKTLEAALRTIQEEGQALIDLAKEPRGSEGTIDHNE